MISTSIYLIEFLLKNVNPSIFKMFILKFSFSDHYLAKKQASILISTPKENNIFF